jgi:hypothetical protein
LTYIVNEMRPALPSHKPARRASAPLSTLRTSARRTRAIEKVEERIKAQHGSESPQMTELQGVKGREAAGFTSALRETFKTIQGIASATTAAIRIGNAVVWEDACASTQTISPEVFASTEWMAIAMRS